MRNRLFTFGGFAHDAEGVLTAVNGNTFVTVEHPLQFASGFGITRCAGLKLLITCPTCPDQYSALACDDQKFSLRHGNSLAPNACENEMAPVPSCQRVQLTLQIFAQTPMAASSLRMYAAHTSASAQARKHHRHIFSRTGNKPSQRRLGQPKVRSGN